VRLSFPPETPTATRSPGRSMANRPMARPIASRTFSSIFISGNYTSPRTCL